MSAARVFIKSRSRGLVKPASGVRSVTGVLSKKRPCRFVNPASGAQDTFCADKVSLLYGRPELSIRARGAVGFVDPHSCEVLLTLFDPIRAEIDLDDSTIDAFARGPENAEQDDPTERPTLEIRLFTPKVLRGTTNDVVKRPVVFQVSIPRTVLHGRGQQRQR